MDKNLSEIFVFHDLLFRANGISDEQKNYDFKIASEAKG